VRPFTVAFVADYFVGWMGGASLLGCLLGGVLRASPLQGARVHVLLSDRVLPAAMRQQLPATVAVPAVQFRGHGGPLSVLAAALPEGAQLVLYKDLRTTLDALQVDVVGPCGFDLGAELGRPWFAYIPDFQHQYLPEYFSQDERMRRDAQFRTLVENAAGVFVVSATVAADIARFYPGAARSKRILRFPQVYPDVSAAFTDQRADTLARLGLRSQFILSCSQRWLHKQHDLLVAGFAEFLQSQPGSPLHLVFTGETHDHRDPGLAARVDAQIDSLGLRSRVHHLGLLARADQLQLVAAAHALVSASRFEGGAGASGTLEAALLGTPIVASDIEPHRELGFGRAVYFDVARSRALAQALVSLGEPVAGPARAPLFDAPQMDLLLTASGVQTLAALRAALA